ncbi:MAG: helix-hairpin-helix domain-containing protein [Actinomycetota bacterium]|nr:helix-hairpin-helix domain-containing protein [Actinomycetota bacterium]
MIVISFLLVVVAAVTLAIGIIQNVLQLVWASIASCLLAIIFLGIGVLQRRVGRAGAPPQEQGYGPGASPQVDGGGWQQREPSPAEVSAAPGVAGARPGQRRWPGPEAAAAEGRQEPSAEAPTGETEVDRPVSAWAASVTEPTAPSEEDVPPRPPPRRPARKAAAKKAATRGAAAKKTATPARAKKAAKKTARAPAKKAAKKAAGGTTGPAAMRELNAVRGLGPAKARALLDRFGSLEAIRDARVDDLVDVRGVGETTAREIHRQLS